MRIKDLVSEYLRHLQAVGRTRRTLQGRKYDLNELIRFLDREEVVDLEDLTIEAMTYYQQDLAFRLTAKGRPLAVRSQTQLLGVAKGFTRFLKEQDYVLHDPGEKIKLPKKPKRLPRVILHPEEVNRLMQSPDMRTHQGNRDRVILEILYDTAVRRSEITRITLADLDLEAGYIHIHGKGDKDRVVPLSNRVCDLINAYILMIRPALLKNNPDEGYLILNRWGRKMHGNGIWEAVKRHGKRACLNPNITPHCLRHTCATHMLKNGAPIRHIQEMLGHESLESTQIYTRVTINDLKKIHAEYHPSETLMNKEWPRNGWDQL